MSSQTVLDLLIGIAVLGLLVVRQLRTRPVQGNQRIMLILLVVGAILAVQYLQKTHAGSVAIVALAGSLVLAAVFGALRAATVRVWIQDGQAWMKGNYVTAGLWVMAPGRAPGLRLPHRQAQGPERARRRDDPGVPGGEPGRAARHRSGQGAPARPGQRRRLRRRPRRWWLRTWRRRVGWLRVGRLRVGRRRLRIGSDRIASRRVGRSRVAPSLTRDGPAGHRSARGEARPGRGRAWLP